MNKHTNATEVCESCEDKLRNSHPEIADWFRTQVKPNFHDCHIAWSYRNKEQQEQCFLDGKTKLHFPLSGHNKSDDQGNQCSMALDLFRLDIHGRASWEWAYFRDIGGVAAHDPSSMAVYTGMVCWSGTWKQLDNADFDHFELNTRKDS